MTPDEAIALVDRVALRPGHTVTLLRMDDRCLELLVRFTGPDADDPEAPAREWPWSIVLLVSEVADYDERTLLERVLYEVVRNEVHEHMEFFRVDGERRFDPHTLGEPDLVLRFGTWFE